ncbi:MAG TPA: hypothetical protein VI814_05040 [Candidatus Limnocylindria bacterium]
MTTVPTPPIPVSGKQERPWIFGAVLIVVGALLFVAQFVQDAGWLVLGGLAVVFLAVYAWTRQPGWVIPGMILAGLAIGLACQSYGYDMNDSAVVLGGLAIVFLAVYAWTRQPGWVIPGMILGGLAVGLALQSSGYDLNDSAVVLGLAGGFLAIAVFNYATATFRGTAGQWWPLIPGGILAVVGISQAVGGTAAADIVERYWPLVLIAVGILVLIGGRQQLARPK